MGQVNVWILILTYAIEPYLWLRTMSVIPRQFHSKKVYIVAGMGYYGLTLFKQFAVFYHRNTKEQNALALSLMIYTIIMSIVLFEGKVYTKIWIFVGFLFLISSMEFIVYSIGVWRLNISPGQLLEISTANWICILVSKLLVIMLLHFNGINRLYKVGNFIQERLSFSLVCLTVVFSFVGAIIFVSENHIEKGKFVILILTFMQIALLINCVFFACMMQKKEKQLEVAEQKIMEMKHRIEVTTRLKQLEHDLGTHASIIDNLVHNKHYTELEEYVERTFQDVKIAKNVCTLSDHVISSVINHLIRKANEKDICFIRHIMMDEFYISSIDVCGIVSNMVENAFDATEYLKKEKRYVSLDIFASEGGYKITCMNPFEKRVECLKTTKPNKDKHGFGIGIIKKLAEKNGGVIEIILDDNSWFEITCFIPVNQHNLNH